VIREETPVGTLRPTADRYDKLRASLRLSDEVRQTHIRLREEIFESNGGFALRTD
jgi:hypothetical protein